MRDSDGEDIREGLYYAEERSVFLYVKARGREWFYFTEKNPKKIMLNQNRGVYCANNIRRADVSELESSLRKLQRKIKERTDFLDLVG